MSGVLSVGDRGALPHLRGRGEPGDQVTNVVPFSALYVVSEKTWTFGKQALLELWFPSISM